MPFLQLLHVSIGYPASRGTKIVQHDLSLTAGEGELIALIGKNGCGKSTLLRSIACLQPILQGAMLFNGENLTEISPKKRARLLSVVLTEQQPVASFTVRELISIGRDPYTGWLGSLSEEDDRIIAEAMEMTYLEGFEQRNIHELSDGERQRVFIARALAQDTPVILLDEPTSHLDLPNRIHIMLLLQKLARETGKTIFISTHELETAMQVADKLWLMEKEKGVTVGVPEDMVLNGIFDSVFHHPSYEFDKEYGSFVVQKLLDKSIATRVQHPGSLMARWTTKALTRKGYRIASEAPVELVVDEERRCWVITCEGRSVVTHSIGEALQQISAFAVK
ncbi:ABC transporter ATP-binding protein [Proteiniphilum sp. UBA1028]|jgi:iron complex transport system ATP-binding protein|uniref:ABC transporter ATP-binding protein n=1 Tax=Proteiniphilum sp. UBA1028 TaxID=1947251 RepID=UPI0025FA9C9B|nr:ABC transporter ATP-binding protein [Proteiniphilum sp. UBA1028]